MKKGNRFILTVLCILSFSVITFGQPNKEERKAQFEKIEAAKKEYFTQELSLTAAESTKFWDLYNEYSKQDRQYKKQRRLLGKEIKNSFDSIPESELKTKMDQLFSIEEKESALRKKYLTDATPVIGYKRSVKSLHLEKEFRKQLMEKVKDKKRGPMMPPPPPRIED